jgi:geranylgeranyl reductase family protein
MMRVRVDLDLDADVAIVGGGPAGAAAACHFRRQGWRVLVLDQHRFPRDKVCGDFVGPAALAEIDGLGLLPHRVFNEANKVSRAALYLDGRKLIAQAFPQFQDRSSYGLCIPRLILDEVMLDGATSSGVRVIEGARVTAYEVEAHHASVFYQTSSVEQRIRVRLLVGADGSSSFVARQLRGEPLPRRDRIVAVRAYFDGVDGPQEQADLYFSSATFPGYCWLFPTGGRSANVGVGTLLETWPATTHGLNQLLTDVIRSDPALAFRLSSARMRRKIVGWPLATFNPGLPIVGNRVILIGDAAGLINPLNGEGIQYALQSARWAAETLQVALRRDELTAADLAGYAARVHRELRYDMAFSRLIIDLISNRTLTPIWLQALRTIASRAAFDHEYAKRAGAILAGIAPTRDILSYRILWGTVEQAALTTAYGLVVDAIRGPERLFQTGLHTARTIAVMAAETALRPTSSLNWGLNCLQSVVELATQVTVSALERPAGTPANEPKIQLRS